jgi:hypothetical protein
VRDGEENSLAIESSHRAKVSIGGDRRRETVKRTHPLSNRAHRPKVSNGGDRTARDGEENSRAIESSHRAKVSNGGDRRRETVKRTHKLSNRAIGRRLATEGTGGERR